MVALVGTGTAGATLRRRLVDETAHAPHLIDAEVGNVVRRLTQRGELNAAQAEALIVSGLALVDHRYEVTAGLARAAWALRDNVTFYDGLYVGLAGALDVPLLTADARLGRVVSRVCRLEVIAEPGWGS